jgi:D-lactate dehydrogenase
MWLWCTIVSFLFLGMRYHSSMNNPIVFVAVDKEDASSVSDRFPDAVIHEGVPEGEQLVSACKGAEVVSGFVYTKFTADVLNQLPDLKLLCTRSVGFNHIDLEACAKNGVTVCNVPDYGSHVIAEHVFALLLSTIRHIPEGDARVESGMFDYHGLRGITLRNKTIGIIGTGKIGRKVAQIAHGFGMKILAVDRCRAPEMEDLLGVNYTEMDDLIANSDIITLHIPSLEETYHMIDKKAIKTMKDGVILINTARGELIDSDAILEALQSGKMKYALLDVLEHERNFEENKDLIAEPNAVTTPHIAFYAEESMNNMYDDCFTSIDQFLKGDQPEHVVKVDKIVCDMKGVK